MTEQSTPVSFAPHPALDVEGNNITLVADSSARFAAYLQLINDAQRSIDIIIYIIEDDESGDAVRSALIGAAQRGVAVRMIIDSFGTNFTSAAFFEPLTNAGVAIHFFSRRWRTSYLIRNHQKILVTDGENVLIGGYNLCHVYFACDQVDGWTDLGLVLRGPAARAMTDWFERLFYFTATADGKWLKLRRMMRGWQQDNPPQGSIQWLVGGPTQRLSPWARSIRTDLSLARQVDMAMAYFAPGQGILRRLGRTARRGSVRLITAARSDNGATIGAARLLYGYLLRKRATIFEYQPQRLHMKLIVVDDAVYVGSANFDMRSLFVNLEMMVRIEDTALAAQARGIIAELTDKSEAVTPTWLRAKAHGINRLRWFLSWFMVSTLDYSVVRGLNFGLEPDPEQDRA